MIRVAERRDVERMLEIYAPYVRETVISMEYEPPSLAVYMGRFESISTRYPWLVYEEGGRVMGYAYASRALERAAYQWDADVSVYLDATARRRGAGSRLYDMLERLMANLGYHNLYALITASNAASCRFHEKRGYRLQGILRRSGFKFGQWYDVNWYCLTLQDPMPPKGPPKAFDGILPKGIQEL